MLKGLAQNQYYNHQLSKKSFKEICNYLRNFFKGPRYYRRNLNK